jgi:hypothetical protein
MTDWYPFFYTAVIILWLTACKSDLAAARILCMATVGSWILTRAFVVHIAAAEKQAIPTLFDLATLVAFLVWSRNRTGWINAVALAVAVLTHIQCYVDVKMNTNLVYDNYERILAFTALVQLMAFHRTLYVALKRALALVLPAPHAVPLDDNESLITPQSTLHTN